MRGCRPFLILSIAAALLNVLVAWSCMLWSPYTSHTAPSDERSANGYPTMIAGPHGEQGWWFTRWGFGVWESALSGARGFEGEFAYFRGDHTPAYYRVGWPMLSLQSTVNFHDYKARWDLPVAEILRRGLQTSWLPLWLHACEERRLPLLPLWFGFAVNTLVYFCVLVGVQFLVIRVLKQTPNLTLQRTAAAPAESN